MFPLSRVVRERSYMAGSRSEASVKRLTLVACILGSGIVMLDGTVVNVALPTIQRALGGGLAGAAVDRQRLPADARIADPRRRLARRPVWRAADLRARRLGVRGRVARMRARAQRSAVLVAARARAGHRRRAARAQLAGGDREHLPRVRARRRRSARGRRGGRSPRCWDRWLGGELLALASWRWIFVINVPLVLVCVWLILHRDRARYGA